MSKSGENEELLVCNKLTGLVLTIVVVDEDDDDDDVEKDVDGGVFVSAELTVATVPVAKEGFLKTNLRSICVIKETTS
jgi:hypothetical protein